MSDSDEPRWPAADPEVDVVAPPAPTVPAPRRRRGRAVVAFALASVVTVLVVGVVDNTAQTMLSVDGTPLPLPPTTTLSTPPSTTSAALPIRPIYSLGGHPLLAQGVRLPDVDCVLPQFRRDTDSLRIYYTGLVGCMDSAWQSVLAVGRLPHDSPSINVAEHPGETGCGNPEEDRGEDFTALYCPTDQTLYLPVNRLKDVDRGGPSIHLAVVAHEYAHHIQELSGLLWAAGDEMGEVGDDTPEGLQLSRRTELQANCFAGLFIAAVAGRGSVSRNLANQAVADFRNGALPDSHGSRANQAAWARKGYEQRATAACNTWIASPGEVS